MKRFYSYLIYFTTILLMVFGIGSISLTKIPDYPPDLKNYNAKHTLQREGNNYLLKHSVSGTKSRSFMIGDSKVDLEPYIGKTVLIHGDYRRDKYGNITFHNTQCIMKDCHQIYPNGDTVVVDIEGIEAR